MRLFSLGLPLVLSLSAVAVSAEPGDEPTPNDVSTAQIAPPPLDIPEAPEPAKPMIAWRDVSMAEIKMLNDDDIHRHAYDVDYLSGLAIGERKFSENGFDWQLIRFTNIANPAGPLWIVPHDDEDAAFEAMIDALKLHGGIGITVNSTGSGRIQSGKGTCGTRSRITSGCDPNRNFDQRSPLYTAAFLDQRPAGQPVIALHTNKPGYGGNGSGHISMYASAKSDSFFGNGSVPELDNADTFGLISYRVGAPVPQQAVDCRVALNAAGINFWHERVSSSDGSMSNYLILNQPDIMYFNAESREEADLAVAAARHRMMVAEFLKDCQTPTATTPAVPVAP